MIVDVPASPFGSRPPLTTRRKYKPTGRGKYKRSSTIGDRGCDFLLERRVGRIFSHESHGNAAWRTVGTHDHARHTSGRDRDQLKVDYAALFSRCDSHHRGARWGRGVRMERGRIHEHVTIVVRCWPDR